MTENKELTAFQTNDIMKKIKETSDELSKSTWHLVSILVLERDAALNKLKDNGLS